MTSTHLSQFQLMAQYNSWANARLYDLAASLTEEERQRNLGAFFQSIHGTLNHLLVGDRAWLGRFSTSIPYQFPALQTAKCLFDYDLRQILYADFAELRRERSETDQAIAAWMQELKPDTLSARMQYCNATRQIERDHSLWFGLAHFFNHQTHHRSQATTLLHQLGKNYGTTDLLALYDLADGAI